MYFLLIQSRELILPSALPYPTPAIPFYFPIGLKTLLLKDFHQRNQDAFWNSTAK